jgi:hypothetical protein
MWMKAFRNAALVLAVVILMVSAAWGAPKDSALVGGGQKGNASLEREVEGGIKITLQEISIDGEYTWFKYIAMSEGDTKIRIDAGELFDNNGNMFSANATIFIGNQNTSQREIIGGVPTRVWLRYKLGEKYVAEHFARISVFFNKENLTFRDVPGTLSAQ